MLTDRRLIAFCEAQTESSLSSFAEFTRIDGGAYRRVTAAFRQTFAVRHDREIDGADCVVTNGLPETRRLLSVDENRACPEQRDRREQPKRGH